MIFWTWNQENTDQSFSFEGHESTQIYFFFKMNILSWSVRSRTISINIHQLIESGCSVPGSGDVRQFQTSAVGRTLIIIIYLVGRIQNYDTCNDFFFLFLGMAFLFHNHGRYTDCLRGNVRKIQRTFLCEVGSIPNCKAVGSMNSKGKIIHQNYQHSSDFCLGFSTASFRSAPADLCHLAM